MLLVDDEVDPVFHTKVNVPLPPAGAKSTEPSPNPKHVTGLTVALATITGGKGIFTLSIFVHKLLSVTIKVLRFDLNFIAVLLFEAA
jgi:hypothetical protein